MKKLILKKETIANLGNREQKDIIGGTGSDYLCTGWNTCARCPSLVDTCKCISAACNTGQCAETCGDAWTCNGR